MAVNWVNRKLNEWTLDEYIGNFMENNIKDEHAFMTISLEVVNALIPNVEKLKLFWEKWLPLNRAWHISQSTVPGKYDHLDPKRDLPIALSGEVTAEKFWSILMKHRTTRSILELYDKSEPLRPEHSKEITHVIVDELVNISDRGWTIVLQQDVATIIAGSKDGAEGMFPNEVLETYWQKTGTNPQGLVPNRFKNRLAYVRTMAQQVKPRRAKQSLASVNTIIKPNVTNKVVQDSLKWLKTSDGKYEEVLMHWNNTYDYRQNWFEQNPHKTIDDILEEWSKLQGPYGGHLLLHDFDVSDGRVPGETIKNWKKFMQLIESQISCKSRDERCKFLKKISQPGTAVNDGARCILQLVHLAHLFPPLGNIKQDKANEKHLESTVRKSNNNKKRQHANDQIESSGNNSSTQLSVSIVNQRKRKSAPDSDDEESISLDDDNYDDDNDDDYSDNRDGDGDDKEINKKNKKQKTDNGDGDGDDEEINKKDKKKKTDNGDGDDEEMNEKNKNQKTGSESDLLHQEESDEEDDEPQEKIETIVIDPDALVHHEKAISESSTNKSRRSGVSVSMTEKSLVRHAATYSDTEKIVLDTIRAAGRLTVQPYIIAVGGRAIEESNEFYVTLGTIMYKAHSGINAIDLCYKIFHTLDAQYPVASQHIWQLIEAGVYKMTSKNELRAYMQSITNTVRTKNFKD